MSTEGKIPIAYLPALDTEMVPSCVKGQLPYLRAAVFHTALKIVLQDLARMQAGGGSSQHHIF
jgi:hypothetical protein